MLTCTTSILTDEDEDPSLIFTLLEQAKPLSVFQLPGDTRGAVVNLRSLCCSAELDFENISQPWSRYSYLALEPQRTLCSACKSELTYVEDEAYFWRKLPDHMELLEEWITQVLQKQVDPLELVLLVPELAQRLASARMFAKEIASTRGKHQGHLRPGSKSNLNSFYAKKLSKLSTPFG